MSTTTTNYNTAKDKKDEVVSRTYGEGSGVGSKSNIERLAEDYVNSNYESFTKGSDYESLAKRYSDQGRKAMEDTMGQVAARTGGLASSYATTAGQQAYGDWMGRLEDAARSLYDSQMAEKASKLGVAQNMYDRGYNEWNDQRDFDYGVAQDDIKLGQYEDSVIDANNEQILNDYTNDVYADMSLASDEDLASMTYDEYIKEYPAPKGFDKRDFELLKQQVMAGRTSDNAVTDWREGYEPTFEIEETEAKLEAGYWSPNLLKNYEAAYGESYFAKKFNDTDWEAIKAQPRETKERMYPVYESAIDAWLAYDEAGCQDYIKSLPDDHPLVEYINSIGQDTNIDNEGVDIPESESPTKSGDNVGEPPKKNGNSNTGVNIGAAAVAAGGLTAAGLVGALGGKLFTSMGKDKYDPFGTGR